MFGDAIAVNIAGDDGGNNNNFAMQPRGQRVPEYAVAVMPCGSHRTVGSRRIVHASSRLEMITVEGDEFASRELCCAGPETEQ